MLYSTSIGLEVHARSISAAAFVFETGEVVQRTFGYDPDAVTAWATSLPQPASCLYESGPWIGNPYLVLKSTPNLQIGTAVVILDQEKVTWRTACTAQSSASWQSRPTSSST